MDNIFYFKKINAIGGTEQFLYEIAKKYGKYDITVFYDMADSNQLKRLRKYVRCQRYRKGEKVKCRKAFFSFNIDMIDDVEAEEYIFVSHAIYQELGYVPPKHPKITKVIGVSQYATKKIGELLGDKIETKCIYNPLAVEPKEKVIHLISATRLDDNTKGGRRTAQLIKAMDEYAEKHNKNYLWLIFTNTTKKELTSPNVCIMNGRVDIRPYIAESDYLVQLSNDMETYCYSINEALSYGVPVITTPLTVLKEFNLNEDMNLVCEWDMSNIDEIVKKIFTRRHKRFNYSPPQDEWDSELIHTPSTYEIGEKIKVRATPVWEAKKITDKERGIVPKDKEEWIIDITRFEELEEFRERTGLKLIEVVNEEQR